MTDHDDTLTAVEADRLRRLLHRAADSVPVRAPAPPYIEDEPSVGRRRDGRGRRLAAAAAVVAMALVGGGVWLAAGPGGDDGRTATAPTTTEHGLPGTDLGDGFTVVEGSRLLGVPVLTEVSRVVDGEEVRDEGWTATTTITGGDPAAILDEYAAQAAAVGLDQTDGPRCGSDHGVTLCSVFARASVGTDLRSFTATMARGTRADVTSDHVVLKFSTDPVMRNYGLGYLGEPTDSAPDAPAAAPLPGVGERLGTAGEVSTELVIVEGSRLAGPVRLNLEDATGGIVVVLEVTGDPEAVLGAYLDQIVAARVPYNGNRRTRQVSDATVTRAYPGGGGGDYFTLTLIERPGHPTWLVIDGGHD